MQYKDVPDKQPNKEHYKDKVCDCEEYCRPMLHVPTEEYVDWTQHGYPVPFRPPPPKATCGLLLGLLDICKSCTSVYYNHFYHPYQISIPKYGTPFENRHQKTGHYCWHCLEAGMSTKLHVLYSKVPKTPPREDLLNPYMKPLSVQDRLDKLAESMKNFDALFG